MPRLHFLLASFFICQLLQAQNTFSKIIQGDNGIYPYDLTFTGDNKFLVTTNDPLATDFEAICISKINFHGKLIWAKRYSVNNEDITYPNVCNSANEGFILAANLTHNVLLSGLLVFEADSSGNIIWKRIIKAPGRFTNGPSCVTETADGSVYVVFYWKTSEVCAEKFDKNGTPLWQRFIPLNDVNWYGANIDDITTDFANGMVLTLTSFNPPLQKKLAGEYKILILSKDGVPENEYLCDANDGDGFSDKIICDNKGRFHILSNKYVGLSTHYDYTIFDPVTLKSIAYNIGTDINSVVYFLKTNNVDLFKNTSYPNQIKGYNFSYGFLNDWFRINTSWNVETRSGKAQTTLDKYDSTGRICPDYTTPVYDTSKSLVVYTFKRTSFSLINSEDSIDVGGENVVIESLDVDRLKTLCEGVPENLVSNNNNEISISNEFVNYMLFPNPASNKTTLKINGQQLKVVQIEIIDFDGTILQKLT